MFPRCYKLVKLPIFVYQLFSILCFLTLFWEEKNSVFWNGELQNYLIIVLNQNLE